MPTKKKTESQQSSFHEVKVSGIIPGSSYALYIAGNPRRFVQGTADSERLIIKVPATLSGNAELVVKAPRTQRLYIPSSISKHFKLEGTTTIELRKDELIGPTNIQKEDQDMKGKKLIDNKLQKRVQVKKSSAPSAPEDNNSTKDTNKTLLENKLSEQVQAKKKGINKTTDSSSNPLRDPEGKFVSKKKLITSKLQEAVQNRKGNLDTDSMNEE